MAKKAKAKIGEISAPPEERLRIAEEAVHRQQLENQATVAADGILGEAGYYIRKIDCPKLRDKLWAAYWELHQQVKTVELERILRIDGGRRQYQDRNEKVLRTGNPF